LAIAASVVREVIFAKRSAGNERSGDSLSPWRDGGDVPSFTSYR
jgi:hypothetical protein